MLADKQRRETEEIKAKAQISNAQPDDLIDFYHLKSRKVWWLYLFTFFVCKNVIIESLLC
jgi:coatomer subunit beta